MKEPSIEFSRIYKLDTASKALIHRGKELYYEKNKIIVSPGEILEGFYFIKQGRVISFEYSPRGNEKVICILEAGSIFLESNTLFEVPAFSYFKTTEAARIIFVKREDLLDLLAEDLDVTLFIMESLTKKFYSYFYHVEELLFHDSEWRICNLFSTFADNFGVEEENKIKLNIKVSQQFISNILGMNRITLARIIRKLKKLRLIEQTDGYYYIKDLKGLRDYQAALAT